MFKKKNHQGIFAEIYPFKKLKIQNLLPIIYKNNINPIILILDKITDIRNFGAIVRTAVCSGVNSIILPNKYTALIGPDSIKTSSGSLFKIPICQEKNILNTIKFLKKSGIQIIAATEKSTNDWYNINFIKPIALIIGNEEKGITKKYIDISCQKVKIPSVKKDFLSLNVSVACGILLYEIFRQRKLYVNNE